jgi:hypothetical protein
VLKVNNEVDVSDLVPVSEQHAAFRGTESQKNPMDWKVREDIRALSGNEKPDDDFFNAKDPNIAIKHESPLHRMMCYLKAQGLSNREIAVRTGKSETWVSQVLRQPWARDRVKEEMKAAGQDAIQTVITAAAMDSVYKLIEIRDNEKAKPSEQLAAANSLLDRFMGKPTQKIESENKTTIQTTDVAELQAELATAEAELKRRGISAGGVN